MLKNTHTEKFFLENYIFQNYTSLNTRVKVENDFLSNKHSGGGFFEKTFSRDLKNWTNIFVQFSLVIQ
jgi:hypothetical protein